MMRLHAADASIQVIYGLFLVPHCDDRVAEVKRGTKQCLRYNDDYTKSRVETCPCPLTEWL